MKTAKKFIPLIIIIIVLAIIFFSPLTNYLNIEFFTSIINSIKGSPYAPIIFIALYILAVVLLVPGLALTLLAAPIFGLWQGILYVVIASNIGCSISFFISRFLGKDFVLKLFKGNKLFEKVNSKIEKNGLIYMFYLRLIPVFPFNLVNYAPGVTSIKYSHYAIATFFGMLPGTSIYCYAAYTASDIKENPLGIIIAISILILFTVITTIISKKQNKKEEQNIIHNHT